MIVSPSRPHVCQARPVNVSLSAPAQGEHNPLDGPVGQADAVDVDLLLCQLGAYGDAKLVHGQDERGPVSFGHGNHVDRC